MAIAVKLLVIDAIRNTESRVTGAFVGTLAVAGDPDVRELAIDDDAPRRAGNVGPLHERRDQAVDLGECGGELRPAIGISESGRRMARTAVAA